ncbi:hypothetical protein OH76DRAFT_771696 [Lentinus brumalis]|uniref:Uncharacterized protein n=1 Tax=Lentinus brumalis TaxID=2498619 RepID=A0A371D4T0_9APHY|nr:hypothetical protein OH76DRAFT_771696 [Polyporus brumalis]
MRILVVGRNWYCRGEDVLVSFPVFSPQPADISAISITDEVSDIEHPDFGVEGCRWSERRSDHCPRQYLRTCMPVITSFVFHLVLYGFRLGTSVEHASSDHERCFKTCLGSMILL